MRKAGRTFKTSLIRFVEYLKFANFFKDFFIRIRRIRPFARMKNDLFDKFYKKAHKINDYLPVLPVELKKIRLKISLKIF